MDQHKYAVDEITQNVGQLIVHSVLEIIPSKFTVLLLGHDTAQHIAQLILAFGEIEQILVQPNGPIA